MTNLAALSLEMALALCAADRPVAPQPSPGCCQECVGGIITHGDGHKTPCPCPATCSCKSKSKQEKQPCETGSCQLQPKTLTPTSTPKR